MRSALYLIVLACLALASGWFLNHLESTLRAQREVDATLPNLELDTLQLQHMGGDGRIRYRLYSPYVQRSEALEQTALTSPFIELYTSLGTEVEWSIRAQRGWLETRTVRLEGEVIAYRLSQPMLLRTESLRIDIDADLITSDRPVSLRTPSLYLRADALSSDLEGQHLELHRAVRSIHETVLPAASAAVADDDQRMGAARRP